MLFQSDTIFLHNFFFCDPSLFSMWASTISALTQQWPTCPRNVNLVVAGGGPGGSGRGSGQRNRRSRWYALQPKQYKNKLLVLYKV